MNLDGPVPGIPGATVRSVDALPVELPGGLPAGRHVQARPGQLLLTVSGIGRYFVQDGTLIEAALDPGADPGMAALLLHGTARGALIHQRGELPLHAATLVPPEGDFAIAICGASGAGKSTLGTELSRRGWMLVADDTTRITWTELQPMAWPSRDSIKLWRDACEAKGADVSSLERVAAGLDKYYLHVPARAEPVRLAVVFELTQNEGAPFVMESVSQRMALLTRHTYRQAQIRPLGRFADYVRLIGQVAGACRAISLGKAHARPVGVLADVVEEAIRICPR